MSQRTILVPLDGSPEAEQVIPWALFLARRSDASLNLVGVHAPPAVVLDGETLAGSVVPDQSIRERETEYLGTLQTRLKSSGVPLSAQLLDGGVVAALTEHARNLKPDWIVMLSHGRSTLARFFVGETAHEFMRETPCPLLLIRESTEPPPLDAVPAIRHILVPLDGSETAERILAPAAALAKLAGADITLLMALAAVPDMEAIAARHEPGLPGPWNPEAAPAKAELYLEHKADRLRAQSLRATCKVIQEGTAADVITAQAGMNPGSVIALATHGRGGLSKLIWGSVTDEVTRRATGPILLYRPE